MKKSVFFCAILFVCLNSLFSAVIQVPDDYGTIQDGIDAAVSGDTVKVEAGTYYEHITLKDGVSLVGAGEEVTIIDGSGTDRVVHCEDCGEGTQLEGFTITNGNTALGGGMYNLNSTAVISNCTFLANNANNGGGMVNEDSSITLSNCKFTDNTSYWGGGMLNRNSTVNILNCAFTGNSSSNSGGAMRNMTNSTVQITECTFVNNTAGDGAGGVHCANGTIVTIADCYFENNLQSHIYGDYTDGGGNNYGYFVDGDMNNTADYRSVQAAINAAVDGDTVIVMPGRYVENINMSGKAITLRSSDPEDPNIVAATIIDGRQNGSVITCKSGEESDTLISGFVITNGSGAEVIEYGFTYFRGGGMYNSNSSPAIENCTFSGNTANAGGGMYNGSSNPTIANCTFSDNDTVEGGGMCNDLSSPTIANCTFSDNVAGSRGGGMYNGSSNPTIANCTFSDNDTVRGGGMNNTKSNPTIENCTFSDNDAYEGSGMYNGGSNPTIANCTFSDNDADYGGGMYNGSSNPTIENCTFSINAVSAGGGMYNKESNPKVSSCTFSINTAADGGGMYNKESSPTIENCTIIENRAENGGGVYNLKSASTITNSIIWFNTASGSGNEIYTYSGQLPIIAYSNIRGCGGSSDGWDGSLGTDGGGNIDSDPMFVRMPDDGGDGWGDKWTTKDIDESANDDYGDLRLLASSPCIDSGDSTVINEDITTTVFDFDGNPRFVDIPMVENTGISQDIIIYGSVFELPIDMGAYEFHISDPIEGDLTGDGKVDMADLAVLAANWLVSN